MMTFACGTAPARPVMWPEFFRGGVQTITPDEINDCVDYMEAQLKELMTNYGDVTELWLDGGWFSDSKTLDRNSGGS